MVTQPLLAPALGEFEPALPPGSSYDTGFGDTVAVPCGAAAQPFGTVVAHTESTGVSVLPVGANPIAGVALREHQTGSRRANRGSWVQYEAIPAKRRGRVWAAASGACTKGAVARFVPATGMFATAGSATYPNAKFLTADRVADPVVVGDAGERVVLVELHSPAVP